MRLILTVMMAMLPLQALALSCAPWGVTNAYQQADASSARYLVVQGQLSFDPSDAPKPGYNFSANIPKVTKVDATFTGKRVSRRGYAGAFNEDLELSVSCAGPWCSGAPVGQDILAFVKRTKSGFELEARPCVPMFFVKPTEETLRSLRQCLRGRACKEQSFD